MWWTDNSCHVIIWDIATILAPLCSAFQGPSPKPNHIFLAPLSITFTFLGHVTYSWAGPCCKQCRESSFYTDLYGMMKLDDMYEQSTPVTPKHNTGLKASIYELYRYIYSLLNPCFRYLYLYLHAPHILLCTYSMILITDCILNQMVLCRRYCRYLNKFNTTVFTIVCAFKRSHFQLSSIIICRVGFFG